MQSEKVTLVNEVGLHARPAALLVQEVSKFKAEINLVKSSKSYNARSIFSVLSMAACKGDEITIVANGEDENEAIDKIKNLILSFKD